MPLQQIDPVQPLNSLGMDSLTAMEIKSRIEHDLRTTLPVVKFLNGHAISDFVTDILNDLATVRAAVQATPAVVVPPVAQAPSQAVPSSPTALPAEIDAQLAALSASQVDDLLTQLLKEVA
jgi:phthiocerol/phenolphthiocerol synthesis type-I polyketide synthase C